MGVVGVWVNTKIYQRNTTRLQAHTQIIMCKQKEEKKAGNIASSVCDIRLCETAECLIYEADQESSH
jgi:hypothetical protein